MKLVKQDDGATAKNEEQPAHRKSLLWRWQ